MIVLAGLLVAGCLVLLGLSLWYRHRLTRVLAEQAHGRPTEHARTDEQSRLAAEMRDAVTSRLNRMVSLAGELSVTAPDEATRTAAGQMGEIGRQSVQALAELVDVLGGESSTDQVDPTARMPDLTELVARSTAAELIVYGSPTLASPVIVRTVTRVVQEALTNADEYAPGARTLVHVRYGVDRVTVTTRTGPPAGVADRRPGGGESGLLALRQRVELVSGRMMADALSDGSFVVDVVLPPFTPTAD